MELFLLELPLEKNNGKTFRRLREIKNMGIEVCLSSSPDILEHLKQQEIKTILVQGGSHPGHFSIYCDDYSAGRVAAEYALKMGHGEAGIIFPEGSNHPRLNGFLDTCTKMGGSCPEKFRWFLKFDHEIMAEEIKKLSAKNKKLPSFFYCFADNVMFPAIKGFAANGLKVPENISLMGTDNLYWGKVATPAFTTVDLKEDLFADKLIEAIGHAKNGETPYELAVPVKLLERETVIRRTLPSQ
jgi:DNA-binding LacI/PurR family transcriptional regulator